MEEERGKMVERVAMEERWRIRRAWMADWWMVGILKEDGEGGFEERY